MTSGQALDLTKTVNTTKASDFTKENVLPLNSGKKIIQVETVLNDAECQQHLYNQQLHFERLIDSYEGNDPMKPRCDFLRWIELHCLNFKSEKKYADLLEDTINLLQDDLRYKQDPRFIEIFVKYIQLQKEQVELYQSLFSQGLGTMCAVLYISWADALDKNNDFKRANQVYETGIRYFAQPLDELKKAQEKFQLNLGRRMLSCQITSKNTEYSNRPILSELPIVNQVSSCKVVGNQITTHVEPLRDNNFKKIVPPYQDDKLVKNTARYNKGRLLNVSSASDVNRVNPMSMESCKNKRTSAVDKQKISKNHLTTTKFHVHADNNDEEPLLLRMCLKPIKKVDLSKVCPLALFEPPDPKKKAMYPKQQVYAGGRELQLEELKAALYERKYKGKMRDRSISKDSETGKNIHVYEFKVKDDEIKLQNSCQIKSLHDVPGESNHFHKSRDHSYQHDMVSLNQESCFRNFDQIETEKNKYFTELEAKLKSSEKLSDVYQRCKKTPEKVSQIQTFHSEIENSAKTFTENQNPHLSCADSENDIQNSSDIQRDHYNLRGNNQMVLLDGRCYVKNLSSYKSENSPQNLSQTKVIDCVGTESKHSTASNDVINVKNLSDRSEKDFPQNFSQEKSVHCIARQNSLVTLFCDDEYQIDLSDKNEVIAPENLSQIQNIHRIVVTNKELPTSNSYSDSSQRSEDNGSQNALQTVHCFGEDQKRLSVFSDDCSRNLSNENEEFTPLNLTKNQTVHLLGEFNNQDVRSDEVNYDESQNSDTSRIDCNSERYTFPESNLNYELMTCNSFSEKPSCDSKSLHVNDKEINSRANSTREYFPRYRNKDIAPVISDLQNEIQENIGIENAFQSDGDTMDTFTLSHIHRPLQVSYEKIDNPQSKFLNSSNNEVLKKSKVEKTKNCDIIHEDLVQIPNESVHKSPSIEEQASSENFEKYIPENDNQKSTAMNSSEGVKNIVQSIWDDNSPVLARNSEEKQGEEDSNFSFVCNTIGCFDALNQPSTSTDTKNEITKTTRYQSLNCKPNKIYARDTNNESHPESVINMQQKNEDKFTVANNNIHDADATKSKVQDYNFKNFVDDVWNDSDSENEGYNKFKVASNKQDLLLPDLKPYTNKDSKISCSPDDLPLFFQSDAHPLESLHDKCRINVPTNYQSCEKYDIHFKDLDVLENVSNINLKIDNEDSCTNLEHMRGKHFCNSLLSPVPSPKFNSDKCSNNEVNNYQESNKNYVEVHVKEPFLCVKEENAGMKNTKVIDECIVNKNEESSTNVVGNFDFKNIIRGVWDDSPNQPRC